MSLQLRGINVRSRHNFAALVTWLLTGIATTVLLISGGCALLPVGAPHDLTFVSARVVPIANLPPADRDEATSNGLKPRTTIEVTFSSNQSNLMKAMTDRIATNWCENWPDKASLHNDYTHIQMQDVYWHDIDISRSQLGPTSPDYAKLPAAWKAERPYLYRIYLWSNMGDYYDFARESKDVCFQMFTVGMVPVFDYQGATNTLIIPGAAIKAALDVADSKAP